MFDRAVSHCVRIALTSTVLNNKTIGKCSDDIVLNRVDRDMIQEEVLHPIRIGKEMISIGVCLGVGVLV